MGVRPRTNLLELGRRSRRELGDHSNSEQWRTNSGSGGAPRQGDRSSFGSAVRTSIKSAGDTIVTATSADGTLGAAGDSIRALGDVDAWMTSQQHELLSDVSGIAGSSWLRCPGQQHELRTVPSSAQRYHVAITKDGMRTTASRIATTRRTGLLMLRRPPGGGNTSSRNTRADYDLLPHAYPVRARMSHHAVRRVCHLRTSSTRLHQLPTRLRESGVVVPQYMALAHHKGSPGLAAHRTICRSARAIVDGARIGSGPSSRPCQR